MEIHGNFTKRLECGVFVFAVAILLACSCSAAHAGLVTTDTVNAMPGWFGTKSINFVEDSSGKVVDGSIDYAVYAPGQFNLSFPGQDPSNGARYVYRFQLHNNAVTSGDFIIKFTLALVGLSSSTDCKDCKSIATGSLYPSNPTNGLAPPIGYFAVAGDPPTSVYWRYKQSAPLVPGYDSRMLIFTSPDAPALRLGTINSQDTGTHYWDYDGEHNRWEGLLPSPIPEPGSLFGLMSACSVFVGYRVLRRKKD
jgi:hypothetical protein